MKTLSIAVKQMVVIRAAPVIKSLQTFAAGLATISDIHLPLCLGGFTLVLCLGVFTLVLCLGVFTLMLCLGFFTLMVCLGFFTLVVCLGFFTLVVCLGFFTLVLTKAAVNRVAVFREHWQLWFEGGQSAKATLTKKVSFKKLIKLVNFKQNCITITMARWLTSIVFCFLIFITFLHIVCFKIYIIIIIKKIYLGPHWPKIGLPENVETIWLTNWVERLSRAPTEPCEIVTHHTAL
jgi:hypothetical protein